MKFKIFLKKYQKILTTYKFPFMVLFQSSKLLIVKISVFVKNIQGFSHFIFEK